jgi:hypothetical protein
VKHFVKPRRGLIEDVMDAAKNPMGSTSLAGDEGPQLLAPTMHFLASVKTRHDAVTLTGGDQAEGRVVAGSNSDTPPPQKKPWRFQRIGQQVHEAVTSGRGCPSPLALIPLSTIPARLVSTDVTTGLALRFQMLSIKSTFKHLPA